MSRHKNASSGMHVCPTCGHHWPRWESPKCPRCGASATYVVKQTRYYRKVRVENNGTRR
jgi:rubrerythrin